MRDATRSISPARAELARVSSFLRQELRPRGRILTPFNVITATLVLATAVILFFRFAYGLGSVTNLNQDYPWGLWIGFDVVTGVAFAGGAYVVVFLVHVLNLERYRPIVRVTVLNGFLAYVFYAGALVLDLGRPWNVINPVIGNSFGVSSVLFLVAWHFMLYMLAELIEFSPAIAEWLGLERLRRFLERMTLGAVILGISLSILHQSGLGALFLMAKSKIQPLWYSEFIPIQFLVSSVFAGLSMVIFEGTISRRVFHHRASASFHFSQERIVVGLSRICAGAMFVYLFLQALVFLHGQDWRHLTAGWGSWYLLENVGFVAAPCALFALAWRNRSTPLARWAAVLAMLGVILNRLNVSVIAWQPHAAVRYVPTWMEFVVTLGVISAEIWVFRWIVNRMPVLREEPAHATTVAPVSNAEPTHLRKEA
ncbi:MAG: Ni/Fe-hydrogenase cytochrome b subunit [Planctomycetes bacterium]|nr:Ni/Fe-hydrogenase cytochrome b subunit [Planctomycetota bacterium]